MNRFTYDNVKPEPTARQREFATQSRPGINYGMSKQRRYAKQSRHRQNQQQRIEQSRNKNRK